MNYQGLQQLTFIKFGFNCVSSLHPFLFIKVIHSLSCLAYISIHDKIVKMFSEDSMMIILTQALFAYIIIYVFAD